MYKKLIVSIWSITIVLWTFFSPAFADEPLLITAEGEYVMGAGETMEVAADGPPDKSGPEPEPGAG